MKETLIDFGGATLNHCSPVRHAGTPAITYVSSITSDALSLGGDVATWVLEAAKKLEALGRLERGWDSHGGIPLDPCVRKFAVRVLGWLENDELPTPAVVLSSPGTVAFEWRAKGKELEVELEKNGAIDYVKVLPTGEVYEGKADSNVLDNLRLLTSWLMHG